MPRAWLTILLRELHDERRHVIEFRVKEEERERFLRLLTGVLRAMRSEATYIDATLHVDSNDQQRFLLHEVWRDHEDVVTVQLHRPYRVEWHVALPELLTEDRELRSGRR